MKITKENIGNYTIVKVLHNGNCHYYLAPSYRVSEGDNVVVEGKEIGTVINLITPWDSHYSIVNFFMGDGDYHMIDGLVEKFEYADEAEDESNPSNR